jgi:hypothetical protein
MQLSAVVDEGGRGALFHPDRWRQLLGEIVSKEARCASTPTPNSVPEEFVGKTVHVRADDRTVRVVCDGQVIARHARSSDRRHHVEDPAHTAKLLGRRKGARGIKRKDRLAEMAPAARMYLQEFADFAASLSLDPGRRAFEEDARCKRAQDMLLVAFGSGIAENVGSSANRTCG